MELIILTNISIIVIINTLSKNNKKKFYLHPLYRKYFLPLPQ